MDSIGYIGNSLNKALAEHGLPGHSIEQYKLLVGFGRLELLRRAAGEGQNEEFIAELAKTYQQIHDADYLNNIPEYDGITEMLDGLIAAGVKIGIVTNKMEYLSVELAKKLFPGRFSVLYGTCEGRREKPDTHMAEMALRDLGISAGETLFVGDTNIDILTARAAGMCSVGVSWGFRGHRALKKAGADYIIDSPGELFGIIES